MICNTINIILCGTSLGSPSRTLGIRCAVNVSQLSSVTITSGWQQYNIVVDKLIPRKIMHNHNIVDLFKGNIYIYD